jgi:pimeloyl-ACP methyl ester carboxylesterase
LRNKICANILLLLMLALPTMADEKGVAHIPLPAELNGTLNGAEFKIRAPENWNGTLLVFAHGTQATNPGVAEIAPTAWPTTTPLLEEQLLQLGYALAGAGHQNDDKDAVQRTLALTNFFKGHVGIPSRTIIWGNSFGGRVTLKLVEDHPGIYDAAIANCPAAAGLPENMDWGLSFSLAYASAFGWQDAAWGPVENLRDDLDFFKDVYPIMVMPNAATFGRWEFIRLVMQIPPPAFWGTDGQTGNPLFGLGFWKATWQRAQAEATNGGPVAENVGMQYTLTTTEKAYLSAMGVDAEPLLAFMNARNNIAADLAARKHAAHWGQPTGKLQRPTLTMHAIYDGLAVVSQETAYADLVTAKGAGDQLMQTYVNTVGHCSFTAEQYLTMVNAMKYWLDTGVKPGASMFPASAGFNVSFVPPPWVF